jgi:DNA primase
MRYGEGLLDEILRRTDLVRLVGARVKLSRKGHVFWGLCPFHKEKSPSFKVENERRSYHCFGCGASGDAFKWLQETEGLSFPESVQRLAQEAGVELPKWSVEDEARETRKKSLYDVVAMASAFFEEQLRARAGASARVYLTSRGLDGETCRRFGIGYAPDSNSALKDHLAAQGIGLDAMIEAGLVRAPDGDRPARDFFYNRVMFPIADVRGRIVAFGGRALEADAKPKYINTGETSLFSKGRMLYRFREARAAAARGSPLILAEGYMDVIALVRAGFEGAVAPLGTALTADQLALLWRVAPEPVLCFDGDEAGTRAAARAAHLALPLLEAGYSLRFVFLPKGEDPDSLLRAQGPAPLRALLEKPQALSDVLWGSETEGRDFSTPERRAGLEAVLEGLVKTIRHPKIADYYRQDFRERLQQAFRPQRAQGASGRGDFGSGQGRAGARGGKSWTKDSWKGQQGRRAAGGDESVSMAVKRSAHAAQADGARQSRERELAALLLAAPGLIERHAEILAEFSFMDRELDRLRAELLHLAASGRSLDRTAVETHLVRQGMGGLANRLTAQLVVRTAMEGAADEAAQEAVWLEALARLRDPECPASLLPEGDLKARRDEVLQRYLDQGSDEDWNELQRLIGLIRGAAEAVR